MEKFTLKGKLVESRDEAIKLQAEVQNLTKINDTINNKYNSCKRDLDNTQLNLNALREACTLLESQLIEFEAIFDANQNKEKEQNGKIEDLLKELGEAKRAIQEAKKQANEELSFKLLEELKNKKLSEELENAHKEIESYNNQCSELKLYSNNLAEELTLAEEKINEYEANLKMYERQIEDFIGESKMLKEENSAQLTHLTNLKESNYKLNKSLNETKDNNTILLERINELEGYIAERTNYYKERDLKYNATIQQQTKLIDYLQSKLEENSKKKKTLSDKIFGGSKKENQPPISVVLNYKDLELELVKEREVNKHLREEILQMKTCTKLKGVADVVRSASKVAMREQKEVLEQIVQSPASQKNDLYRQNSVQRMHHNIPHK